jgi:hypothetical protein
MHNCAQILFVTEFYPGRCCIEKVTLPNQPINERVCFTMGHVPLRSYVKGWKIGPSHYLNQDLANVWLDK